MPRNIPMLDAYYAYCPNDSDTAKHPFAGRVMVGTEAEIQAQLDRAPRERNFTHWSGVLSSGYVPAAEDHRVPVMFANFVALLVRDQVNAQEAFRAFAQIPEFRRHIAEDVPGMRDYRD